MTTAKHSIQHKPFRDQHTGPELDGRVRKVITVRGVVQGVGFRPFVYRLAQQYNLTGWVLNHSGGVDIEVEGLPAIVEAFLKDLTRKAPPIARIEGIEATDGPPLGYTRFEIRESHAEEGRYQLISPDVATCAECLREVFDPTDRRYRYPFTNCTNCGPRFTIIRDIPYDRPLTTMAKFVMCPQCQAEYDDPTNRRFHAQPNACPICGPRVWLEPSVCLENAQRFRLGAPAGDPLQQAAELLKAGAILGIKGLGGFHLACDATNPVAVRTLRARKVRPAKPFAVMMATLEEVQQHCIVSEEERRLLISSECPIVLLPWRPESTIVPEVAPCNRYLGVMLPYTPLHHILLRDVGRPLVMTSGNLSEEPIAAENDEALRRLGPLADFFLLHNRDIYARYDDSVWFVPRITVTGAPAAAPQPIRRARGYAPFPLRLPFQAQPTLACGPELKNTFCLTRDEYAFLSQHIGDMQNLETLEHFERTIELYQHLFRIEPRTIAHDLHPDYLATRYALARAEREGLPTVAVQHDHAHVASCLVDNGWRPEDGPVIGVVWDGTGYGPDGHIWGGEFLIADYAVYQRWGHLEYLPMPGGEAAIQSPYRLALGYVYALTGQFPSLPLIPNGSTAPSAEEIGILQKQIERHINCPRTSAGGRLFDAVSALLGVQWRVSYDAQAAIELEMTASSASLSRSTRERAYPFWTEDRPGDKRAFESDRVIVVRLRGMFEQLLAERDCGVPVGEIAYRFHQTMANVICAVCERIAERTGLHTVTLSGGCFQNRLLLALATERLSEAGLRVIVHRQVPCNDGGIALGQAAVAQFATRGPSR